MQTAPLLSMIGDLLQETRATKIAQFGKMNVLVAKTSHPNWARACVGLTIAESRIPIKIFSARYNWVVDPAYKEQSLLFLDERQQNLQNIHKEEEKYMIERDYIQDPLNAYLFIGNLLLAGFKPSMHMTWASFFINEVGRALNKEEIFAKLLD